MYFVLTTQNTTDLAIDGNSAFIRFQIIVTKNDFPLRIVARMVIVRAIMDFLFVNRDQLVAETVQNPKLTDIAEKQWETAFVSWKKIRTTELSDPYIRLWLKSELIRSE
ncbi:MAG: hypothetical protein PF503_20000 [Desulfobacula sp.]|jgi:hypothetical protein|nr:hypothetical protein [Desulfobacula sp.]